MEDKIYALLEDILFELGTIKRQINKNNEAVEELKNLWISSQELGLNTELVPGSNVGSNSPRITTPYSYTYFLKESNKDGRKSDLDPTLIPTRGRPNQNNYSPKFLAWWKIYPVCGRKKKPVCWKLWRREKIEEDDMVATLTHNITDRVVRDGQWVAGFIPNCETYLRNRQWEDDYDDKPRRSNGKRTFDEGTKILDAWARANAAGYGAGDSSLESPAGDVRGEVVRTIRGVTEHHVVKRDSAGGR